MDQIKKDRVLAKGDYGIIHLCRRLDTNQQVVQKEISLEVLNHKERTKLLEEVKVLEKFCDYPQDNIVECFGYMHCDDTLFVYMEYCSAGSLVKDIQDRQKRSEFYEESEVLEYVHQIASGLSHMHEHRVMHRDLKPANILIAAGGVLKLADFGLSPLISCESNVHSTDLATSLYMSPEIINEEKCDYSTDIWAFGTVLYELMALKPAFMAEKQSKVIKKILAGDFNPLDDSYNESLQELMKSMLQTDAKERPTCSKILAFKIVHKKKIKSSPIKESKTSATKREESDSDSTPSGRGLELKTVDMSDQMKQLAIDVANEAIDKYSISETSKIAKYLTDKFESEYGGYWGCFIGKFASNKRHAENQYIHFKAGGIWITLFGYPVAPVGPDKSFEMSTFKMAENMKEDAIKSATKAIKKFTNTEHYKIAEYIKDKFETTYGNNWCCTAGSKFKCSYRCNNNYINFRTGGIWICLFECAITPARSDKSLELASVKMSDEMKQKAIDCATDALDLYDVGEKYKMAQHIKEQFEDMYGGSWCCTVGINFGSFFAFAANHYISFWQGGVRIELFKRK